MRSYAIPEVYGRWFFPAEGGSYRMWRQVDLTVIQGRNLGIARPLAGVSSDGTSGLDLDSRPETDVVDLDVSCEIHLNDILCGRTTVKKGIGPPDWHESFTFSDIPPFENLDIIVWREKRLIKPTVMGSVRVTLSNFRRGETVEGWFPVLHNGTGLQIGDIRLKIRVDE
jgi:C2 domain